MPRIKVNDEISRDAEKQKKQRVTAESVADQSCYVDSNRNIAVSLENNELSKALKDFDIDVIISFNAPLVAWSES